MLETYTDPETGIKYWWCVDCGGEYYDTDIAAIVEANGTFTGQCFECIQEEHDAKN